MAESNALAREPTDAESIAARLSAAQHHGSVWERRLVTYIAEHFEAEREMVAEYSRLAEEAPEEHVRYLASLIVEDERRHHRMLLEMFNRAAGDASFKEHEASLPRLAPATDREALAALTDRLLDAERHDQRELKRLRREVRPLRATTLHDLMLDLIELDTKKHMHILRFLRRHIDG